MSFHLDYLLDLPGITVENCSYIEGYVRLQLRIMGEGIECPSCGIYTRFGNKLELQTRRVNIYFSNAPGGVNVTREMRLVCSDCRDRPGSGS